MTAHLTRCHCAECGKLDRLPARRQGIPGAFQMTFDNRSNAPIDWPEVDPYQPIGPRSKQASPDSLPLFIGALEPTLF
jgi:hypothetical protein